MGRRLLNTSTIWKKIRSNAKVCKVLLTSNGREVTDQQEIIQEQVDYYTDLYKSDPAIEFKLENTANVQLSSQQYEDLNRPLTFQELTYAMQSMAKDKSPGPDGLPVEVYETFWKQVGPILYESYIFSSKPDEAMHSSAMHGILNLIPKVKKGF